MPYVVFPVGDEEEEEDEECEPEYQFIVDDTSRVFESLEETVQYTLHVYSRKFSHLTKMSALIINQNQ